MARACSSAIRVEAFIALHSAGWADSRIGAALAVRPEQVRTWRDERGLQKNPGRSVKIDETEGRAMHAAGANDHQIARRFSVLPSAVVYWRQRRGLAPNAPSQTKPPEVRRKAKKMLRLGATRKQVAEACGLHIASVQAYRCKMNDPGLRRTGLTNLNIRSQVVKDARVVRRIERAVGVGLPPDVLSEATSSLYLAVLDGLVAVDLIEKVAPSYRNRAYEMCGSKFGPVSLDEEIGDDGWTLMDSLEDPDALEALEAAAEAAWNDS